MSEKLPHAIKTMYEELGYDSSDVHMKDSPERIARFMREWHTFDKEPPKLTTFPNEPRVDELVACGRIPFYSLCAHHGLPFFGRATIGYIPNDKVLGLSKFARALDYFAHRYQVQERLTKQVADFLQKALEPRALGVVLRGEHLCMSMRGVERPGHQTVTSDLRGLFRQDAAARAELITLL